MTLKAIQLSKSSRTMELLITSAKSATLMFGKIMGTYLACVMQMGVILAASSGPILAKT